MNANVVNTASGRQVSTWAHVVKVDELSVLGVFPPFWNPLSILFCEKTDL
jgi:hypothetical protein